MIEGSKNRNISSTREEITEFVERNGHDPIGGVKGLLDTITMMNVDINVQYTCVLSKCYEQRKTNLSNSKLAKTISFT